MALVVDKTTTGREYKVKDMSMADCGRDTIWLDEQLRPNLMSLRTKLGPTQPFKGVRITAMLNMTPCTAVFIETLTFLGAEVRWCSSTTISTQDAIAAAIARDSAAVFAWKEQTLQESLWCTERALDWGPAGGGPDMIIDNLADATLLIHMGLNAEEEYEKSGKVPDPTSTDDAEHQILLTTIRDGLRDDPKKYFRIKERLVGVFEETPTGVMRLYQMQANRTLQFPAININGFTESKYQLDNLRTYDQTTERCNWMMGFGPSEAPVIGDGTVPFIAAGKVTVVDGYGYAGRACAAALKQAGAKVIVTETDPVRHTLAVKEGFSVLPQESVLPSADIYVITGSNRNIFTVDHMRKMKNNAIVCNIGHFGNQIDMLGLEACPGVKRMTILQGISDKLVFPDTNKGIFVLGEGGIRLSVMNFYEVMSQHGSVMSVGLPDEDHPMYMGEMFMKHYDGVYEGRPMMYMDGMIQHHYGVVTVCSLTDQVTAMFELWNERNNGKYKNEVYVLPKCVDVKVDSLHPREPRFRDKVVGSLPGIIGRILFGGLMCFCNEENFFF